MPPTWLFRQSEVVSAIQIEASALGYRCLDVSEILAEEIDHPFGHLFVGGYTTAVGVNIDVASLFTLQSPLLDAISARSLSPPLISVSG